MKRHGTFRMFVALVMLLTTACIMSADDSLIAQEETAFRAAADTVAESVVQIRTIGGLDVVDGTLLADGPTTGLIISPDGYIISSAFNFVQRPASILVTLPSGKQAPAELVATDHSRMTVLLKISGVADLPVPTLAPADEAKPGQWAVAVGRTFRSDRVNISVGVVSAVNRMFGKAIQTDADVSTACYGGPLVDIRGRVLGLIVPMAPQATSEVAGAEWYDSGIGFAVPLAPLAERIEQMKKGEDLRVGLLGIGLDAGNPHSSPAELAAVHPESPAGLAGLKRGDRIIELDGRPIRNQTDLRFALGPRYGGETVNVAVKRGDEQLNRDITLVGELPPFRHAFLGILPMRTAVVESNEKRNDGKADEDEPKTANSEQPDDNKSDDVSGIVVRMVYPGGPADEAGVRAGDRIIQIDETKVASIDDAIGAMDNAAPGVDVKLKLERADGPVEILVQAVRMPTNVPSELPPAYEAGEKAGDKDAAKDGDAGETQKATARTSGEIRDIKLPEFANRCKAYLPATPDVDRPLAVVLWLHAPGETNAQAVIDQWKDACDRDGILFVAPSAAQADRWEKTELEYLKRLTERIIAEYNVDRRRVVVFGHEGGGAMAWLLGLSGREVFRGIATSSSPLPRQVTVPANNPTTRFAIFSAIPAAKDVAAQIASGLKKFADAGYPITTSTSVESGGKLSDAQREELVRWIDTLDRF